MVIGTIVGSHLPHIRGFMANRDGSLMRFQKANYAISHISTVMQYKTL